MDDHLLSAYRRSLSALLPRGQRPVFTTPSSLSDKNQKENGDENINDEYFNSENENESGSGSGGGSDSKVEIHSEDEKKNKYGGEEGKEKDEKEGEEIDSDEKKGQEKNSREEQDEVEEDEDNRCLAILKTKSDNMWIRQPAIWQVSSNYNEK